MPISGNALLAGAWRIVRARRRLFISLVVGCVAAALLPDSMNRPTRANVAWDSGVVVYLLMAAFLFITEPSDRIAENAVAQEEGEWTIFWITVAGVSFSFVAIVNEFADMKDLAPGLRSEHVALVAVTLLVSWLMTHTTFAFRYAHEYYEADTGGIGIAGGLEFPGEKRPDYLDFMYFSLVIGMTFQVSDVQITSRQFRRLAAVQGFLSFLFNTIIVALTVNLAAGLLS